MHQLHLVRTENGHESLTVFLPDGAPVVATDDHPQFAEIVAAAKSDAEPESIRELADVSLAVKNHFEKLTDRVLVANGRVYIDGDELKSTLTEHILRLLEAEQPFDAEVKFLENLIGNPIEDSREHLYGWLEGRNFQITDDGCVICYKGVDSLGTSRAQDDGTIVIEYGSCHHGPGITDGVPNDGGAVINYVGATVEMFREDTEHNPNRNCGPGLHVGTYEFARSYGDTRLTVKVNPRDVISVPREGEKMRVRKYVVLDDDAKHPDTTAPVYTAPKPEPEVYADLWYAERNAERYEGHTEFVATGEVRPAKAGEFALYTDDAGKEWVYKLSWDHDNLATDKILVPKD